MWEKRKGSQVWVNNIVSASHHVNTNRKLKAFNSSQFNSIQFKINIVEFLTRFVLNGQKSIGVGLSLAAYI